MLQQRAQTNIEAEKKPVTARPKHLLGMTGSDSDLHCHSHRRTVTGRGDDLLRVIVTRSVHPAERPLRAIKLITQSALKH